MQPSLQTCERPSRKRKKKITSTKKRPALSSNCIDEKNVNAKRLKTVSNSGAMKGGMKFKNAKGTVPKARVPYKCKSCDEEFNLFSVFKQHVLFTHKGVINCKNNQPSESVTADDSIIDSVLALADIKECSAVENETENDELSSRIAQVETSDSGIYFCNICKMMFNERGPFQRHMKEHKVHTRMCHICGKSFNRSGSFSYHMQHVHLGIKNHTCNVCNRSFSQKHFLAEHMRIHTGERPFICDLCGKTFKASASLYIHKRSHTNEFPFTCSLCPKTFRTRQHVENHFVTHTGEKKFNCDICTKKFSRKNELKRHKMIHNDGLPFACSVCSLAFKVKRYLRNHMKTKHNMKLTGFTDT